MAYAASLSVETSRKVKTKIHPPCVVPNAEEGIEYEVQRFKGTFGLQSPFTGVGPEVDAAWNHITDGSFSSPPLLPHYASFLQTKPRNDKRSAGRRRHRHHQGTMGSRQ